MTQLFRREKNFENPSCCKIFLILGLITFLSNSLVRADEIEHRDYKISIDGKQAGAYHMAIQKKDDGTIVLSGNANISVSFYLVKTYKYSYQGTEVWRNSRLLQLDSRCNDDGNAYSVNAVLDNDNLRVRVNGQEHLSRPDVWTTTFWNLPEAKYRNNVVALLDSDTGKDINAQLQHLGESQLAIGGQVANYAHYRVIGTGVQAEGWYDGQERLVKRMSVEDGHQCTLELVNIRH